MMVTERDQEIVRFVEKFGFGLARQVGEYLKTSEFVAWRRMKKMVEAGYLVCERIFHGRPGTYLVTVLGRELIGSEKKSTKPINIATYDHDLVVLDIAIFFHLQGYEITSEKELRRTISKGIGERGQRERTPDLALKRDGKTIAVEFENSPKSASRMASVLRFFARSRKYDECWFFCSNETLRGRWEKSGAMKNSRIKLLMWEVEKNAGKSRAATGS